MTTDDFTEAARAYAEQACYQDENIPIAEAGFRAGWKAALTHLAAQEPTEVENPDPSVDYHAMWWKAECEREKAERERDKWHRAALTIQTERDAARNAWHEDREPTDAEREARWVVEHEHQFHGSRCLCGFETDRARTRTEHIMTHYFDEVRTARAARRDEEKR